MAAIKYLIMDVDGSLTDGKIYMGPNGEAMKAFSVKDGYAINYILRSANIVPVIITARKSTIVQHRCEELGIREVHQGKSDKFASLIEVVGSDHIHSCAYFGDDIIDLKCMLSVKAAGGLVGCPADAVLEVKALADYVCLSRAGEGALREFAEWLVKNRADSRELECRTDCAKEYLKSLTITEENVGKAYKVDDGFFYSVQSYQTKTEPEYKLESHKNYVEIQRIISGEELMDISDILRLTLKEKYDPVNDVMFWHLPQRMMRVTLKAGDCIVLYPENAHRGAIAECESQRLIKIVGKVEI